MRSINRYIACLVLFFGVISLGQSETKACDRSEFILDSLVFNAVDSTFSVHTTLCIGGGLAGSTQGGDNNTPVFAIGVWGNPTINLISYTPDVSVFDTLIGDTTGCAMNNFTSTGGFGGTQVLVLYQGSGCNFQCITSTALCGRPHQQCDPYVFLFNELPDSLVALGVEGSGNINLGCTTPPNLDMLIDISDTILPVVWSSINAKQVAEEVEVNWGTIREVNNDHFEVMRSSSNGDWIEIGNLEAAAYSESGNSYSFNDPSPLKGQNQYKIVQVDIDGRFSESEVVSVQFNLESGMTWKAVGPNPTRDILNLSFLNEKEEFMQLQMFDMSGKKVFQKNFESNYGLNKMSLDLSAFGEGAYFLRINGSLGRLDKKIIKI